MSVHGHGTARAKCHPFDTTIHSTSTAVVAHTQSRNSMASGRWAAGGGWYSTVYTVVQQVSRGRGRGRGGEEERGAACAPALRLGCSKTVGLVGC